MDITFVATLAKATTLVDGGWRVSFDLSEHETQAITELVKHKDSALQIAAVPLPKEEW